MKLLLFLSVFLIFFNIYAQKQVEVTPSKIAEAPIEKVVPEVVALPENYEEKVKGSSFNTMEKKINLIVGEAVKKNRVVIEQVNDFIYLQVVPNYAYSGDKGEEQLAQDLMEILNSGKISAPRGAQFMNIAFNEMETMNLPFKKKVTDSTVLGSSVFKNSIDLTYFINVNAVSNRIYNSLENIKEFESVYNSAEKYYRTKYKDTRFLYLIRVPNLIYEIIYTGNLYESVISRYIKESLFIAGVIKKYESEIAKNKSLNFDGRYIKGENILVDLWFLPENTGFDVKKAHNIFKKVLKGDNIKITGSQKG